MLGATRSAVRLDWKSVEQAPQEQQRRLDFIHGRPTRDDLVLHISVKPGLFLSAERREWPYACGK